MKQKGFAFLPFLLANWQIVLLGIVVLSGFLYYKSCESAKENHRNLIAKLEVQAEAARKETERKIAEGKKDKERADESHKRTVARLSRDLKRLRDNPPGSFLPAPAPGSASPDRATVSRSEFDRALREHREAVIGLLAEGDQGIAGLDTAREWAAGR